MQPKPTLLRLVAYLCALPLLSGCILYPHRTLRSWELSGTVLDARTRVPIKGAKVVQPEDSPRDRSRQTTTDASGRFLLPKSYTFHWAASPDGDVPQRRWYGRVTISYPGYLSYQIETLGEITVLLQPVGSLDVAGRVLDASSMTPIAGARVYLTATTMDCRTDSTGHFRLKATPAFYEAYRASQASGQPFLDLVTVDCGDHRWLSFHCGEKDDIRDRGILLQLKQ